MVSISPSLKDMEKLDLRAQSRVALDYGDTTLRYSYMHEFRRRFYKAIREHGDVQSALCQLVFFESLIKQRQEITKELAETNAKWRALTKAPTDNLTEEGQVFLNSAIAFAEAKSKRMDGKLFEFTNHIKSLL